VSKEATGFLYPFIESEERGAAALVADLSGSAKSKIAESRALRRETLAGTGEEIRRIGASMAGRFADGARLFAFGNGGSATDAAGLVELFCTPPSGRPLPAMSLVDDRAVITALANDVGFELAFSRQIIAHGRPGDIAVGFSTSGGSANVLEAIDVAADRGLMTVGLCGYQGGAMADMASLGHCLVVRSESIHRIQEAQAALVFAVWEAAQAALEEGAP